MFKTYLQYMNFICMKGIDINKNKDNSESFYKLTTIDENHHGVQYTDGLIKDPKIDFLDPLETKNGIYFCKYNQIVSWIEYQDKRMEYMRKVTIPEDAEIVMYTDKLKTNKLILGPRQRIWSDYNLCLKIVKKHGSYLEFVDKIIVDEKMIDTALESDMHAFKFVDPLYHTPSMCWKAINTYQYLCEYVRKDLMTSSLTSLLNNANGKRICISTN